MAELLDHDPPLRLWLWRSSVRSREVVPSRSLVGLGFEPGSPAFHAALAQSPSVSHGERRPAFQWGVAFIATAPTDCDGRTFDGAPLAPVD